MTDALLPLSKERELIHTPRRHLKPTPAPATVVHQAVTLSVSICTLTPIYLLSVALFLAPHSPTWG
jgi:hypothetical protein